MTTLHASLDQFVQDYSLIHTNTQPNSHPYLTLSATGNLSFVHADNVVYRTFLSAIGHTFDLPTCAQALRNKIEPLILSGIESSKLEFISTAAKAMVICFQLIDHSVIRKELQQDYVSAHLREEQNLYEKELYILFTSIAQKVDKPIVEIALLYKCPQLAYTLLAKEKHEVPAIARELLQQIVPYCIGHKNDELLFKLIPLDISITHPGVLRRVVFKAIRAKNKEVVQKLVSSKMPFDIVDDRKVPLLCKIIEAGWEDIALQVIQDKIACQLRDLHGNTALHYAFRKLQIESARALLLRIDPCATNNDNETPFQLFLVLLERKIISRDDGAAFLTRFFESTEKIPNGNLLIHQVPQKALNCAAPLLQLKDTNTPLIESLFLLGHSTIQEEIIPYIEEERFKNEVSLFSHKYLRSSVESFICSPYSYTFDHYRASDQSFTPQDCPENVALSDVNELLVIASAHYTQDEHFLLKNSIERFTHRIDNEEWFVGTPKPGSESLKLFYKQIRMHLLHCIHALKKRSDTNEIIAFFDELQNAEPKCGGRYYAFAVDQYLKICCNSTGSFEERLLRAIAQFRSLCLDIAISKVCKRDTDTVHNRNRALRAIGEKYSIPGYEQALAFDDIYVGSEYNIASIEASFIDFYTPQKLICEWIMPSITSDSDMRDAYIDWQKSHIPSEWKNDYYLEIYKELEAASQASTEEFAQTLEKYEIALSPNQNLSKAIQIKRERDFLEEVVYQEDYSFSIEAIINTLTHLKMIKSMFPPMNA